ncbi:porin [Paraburkholderia ginsengiterrae]|uniref:porin n=1 Tax=Paraburkholderia ginsengiterrae TaxID=1462993 RepID=UPI00094FEE14|nr:porin [Paraburkholderia ginsengiterrae]
MTDVTLYGVIDTSIEITNAGNGTAARIDSGAATGSRYGLKGTERLGGGNIFNFQLENWFYSNTGAAFDVTRAWSRQAWIGFASSTFGECALDVNSRLFTSLSWGDTTHLTMLLSLRP